MERVETLCDKLKQQLADNLSVEQMLVTVQMLQSELLHLRSNGSGGISGDIASIHMPISNQPLNEQVIEEKQEEKTIEVLQVDEAEVEAELEEIKKNIENREKIHAQNKPQLLFDAVEDTPTLTHQKSAVPATSRKKEVHESISLENNASLNDKLKQPKLELSDALQDSAIKDLRKAIGVNDRYLFINELFRGDEVMYERSIKTINGFTIFPEAEYWIKRELKLKLAWNDTNPVVKQFDQLIRRRFAAM
jgi:hypothetical protein